MRKTIVIHPLLFAIYPILSLYAHNISFVTLDQIITSLVITIISVLLLFLLLSFIFKNTKKAGLIVSLFVLWFFSYGHIYQLIEDVGLLRGFSPSKVLFIFIGFILIFSIYILMKTCNELIDLTKILNVITMCLLLIPLMNIGIFMIKSGAVGDREIKSESVESKRTDITAYPNIYYIILDAYAREDVLREMYEYDNKDFIDYLIGRGFYVANESVSNYCQTVLSLASSLNFKYLDDLVVEVGAENEDRRWGSKMMRDNRIFSFLKQYGYKTVTFDTVSWKSVRIKNSDMFFSEPGANLFEVKLVDSTPIHKIQIVLRRLRILTDQKVTGESVYDSYRKKILNAFAIIEDLSKEKGPMFFMAHFAIPHQPFVFGENGDVITSDTEQFSIWNWSPTFRDGYKDNYIRQLRFVNKRVREMVDKIIANSSQSPIIILQADHGPSLMLDRENPDKTNLKERMAILNAYYLPGDADKELYPSITPVNTFRIIFNHYFKTNYSLLEDESYFSTWSQPYKFINVMDKTL